MKNDNLDRIADAIAHSPCLRVEEHKPVPPSKGKRPEG